MQHGRLANQMDNQLYGISASFTVLTLLISTSRRIPAASVSGYRRYAARNLTNFYNISAPSISTLLDLP